MLVFAISVVSVPMMLDRNTDGIVAVLTSLKAFGANLPAMLSGGAIIAVVIGAGFALWFVGLVVAVPVIGHGDLARLPRHRRLKSSAARGSIAPLWRLLGFRDQQRSEDVDAGSARNRTLIGHRASGMNGSKPNPPGSSAQ